MDASTRPAGHRRGKSSTSVLKSIITSKSSNAVATPSKTKGKENTTPPPTANPESATFQTPIWAQFATATNPESAAAHVAVSTTKVPLNDRPFDSEMNFTPNDFTPSKQRNLGENQRPGLTKQSRPKSMALPKSKSSISVFESLISSKTGDDAVVSRKSADIPRPKGKLLSKTTKVPLKPEGSDIFKATKSASRDILTIARKGTKVMGLVAAFNSKSNPVTPEIEMDEKDMEAAFEAMLESRNIPENMRQNLRSLKPTVKVNLIRSNDLDLPGTSSSSQTKSAPGSAKDKSHLHTHRRGTSEVIDTETNSPPEKEDAQKSGKRKNRSKTFSFAKSGSSKKQKSGSFADVNAMGNPINLPKSDSNVSLGKTGFFEKKQSRPEDFVSYLRSEQKPEKIEVGKIHKLRQLLRNETVSWVDAFIKLGGMIEIVELLHRIMKVEWREEHEDQLLHEALLCLKALCTTDIALQKLCDVAGSLFPALIAMIFDPEHKGPSEYTTRGIVMSIILAHLSSAFKDPKNLPARAKEVLGYLSDPLPPEDERPMPFILEMRQSRPYKVWHREVSNVTKEVFWIFLHHVNIIPLPTESRRTSLHESASPVNPTLTSEEYTKKYFPQPRPPVPAAPYVGGVEWDVTNYLASHLDLLNAIIASLPTKEDRNLLRKELAASGWEKVMGGTLRLCKEKFYDCVHSGLRTWVAAAIADGWDVNAVRRGPKETPKSPRKSPKKKKEEKPPVLDAPKLDLKLSLGNLNENQRVKQQVVNDWI